MHIYLHFFVQTDYFFVAVPCPASFFLRCFRYVNAQQHGEHQGLDQAEQQAQYVHHQRHQDGEDAVKLLRDHFLAEQVAEQTQCQGEGPYKGFHQGQRQQHTEEGLEIALDAPFLDAHRMGGEKADDRQARRDGQAGRGYGKALDMPRARQQPGVVANDAS